MFNFAIDDLDEMFIDVVGEDSDDPHELLFWIHGVNNVMEWEKPKGN